ncbi:Predicted kinase, aminoglycoside phosphotransferase (APT) family [Spirosomataceae bacterium TFI 002]|nr:Predicted kinase, aminoglycoside phosphotransferase (APT) family [Spirosomataceae bacterium TFI 002]
MNFEIDSAGEIRKGETIDLVSLNKYLKKILADKIVEIKQYGGGFSNLTFELITPGKSYVLRKPPAGAKEIKGGHDMAREFGLLQKIASAGFQKVPKAIHLCENEEIIGDIFYVMEKVDGIILRANDALQFAKEIPESSIRKLSEAICREQAKLHLIDIEETGLIEIGKPDGYVRRQIVGWIKRYLASQTDPIQDMVDIFTWLEDELPESTHQSLIHNDYKYDNLVLNARNITEIKAILDWEMTTVGDPLMDLGATLAYWTEAGDESFTKQFNLSWVKGNLTRKEYTEMYSELTGFDTSNILFYYVFGLFKNAVIIQQIYYRYHKGFTNDPRFKNLIYGVKVLAKKAVKSIQSGELK